MIKMGGHICDLCRKVIQDFVYKNDLEFCSQACANLGRRVQYECGHDEIVGWHIEDEQFCDRPCMYCEMSYGD